ncbi:hypothetical protein BDR06DRAFT_1015116 [Suillus hirtellus]|nr:hypothetical protein BDR06DRAFT_1015116 [Suillus hirtellus]
MANPQGKKVRFFSTDSIICTAAPDAIIRPLVERYVASGYSNPETISRLRTHKETSNFKISLSLLRKRRSQWELKSTPWSSTQSRASDLQSDVFAIDSPPRFLRHETNTAAVGGAAYGSEVVYIIFFQRVYTHRTISEPYTNVHRAIIVSTSGDPYHVPLPSIALADLKIRKDRFTRAMRDSSRMNPGESRTDLIVLLRIIWDQIMLPIVNLAHKLVPATANRTTISGDKATRVGALEALQQNTWVHLACHGKQDPAQPYNSS